MGRVNRTVQAVKRIPLPKLVVTAITQSPEQMCQAYLDAASPYVLRWFHDRTRVCPMCTKRFVDLTRNAAALRCSRKCTIAWSNQKRTHSAK